MVIHVSGEEWICWMSEWMVLFPLSVGPLCTIYVYLAVSESVTAVELSWRPHRRTHTYETFYGESERLERQCSVCACMRLCAWQWAAAGIFYFDSLPLLYNRHAMHAALMCVRLMDVAVDDVVSVHVCVCAITMWTIRFFTTNFSRHTNSHDKAVRERCERLSLSSVCECVYVRGQATKVSALFRIRLKIKKNQEKGRQCGKIQNETGKKESSIPTCEWTDEQTK